MNPTRYLKGDKISESDSESFKKIVSKIGDCAFSKLFGFETNMVFQNIKIFKTLAPVALQYDIKCKIQNKSSALRKISAQNINKKKKKKILQQFINVEKFQLV